MKLPVFDQLSASANAFVRACATTTENETANVLRGQVTRGDEILSLLRADCLALKSKIKSLKDEKSSLETQIALISKAKAEEVRNCHLLASFLKFHGGYSIDDLVSELPEFAKAQQPSARPISGAEVRAILQKPIIT